MTALQSGCPVVHGPMVDSAPRVSLYSPEFARDPHTAYEEMRRRFGSLVPVELSPGVPATLVIGYRTAVKIMQDEEHYPADPRMWEKGIPADCPVLPTLRSRPNALRTAGGEHKRLRRAFAVLRDIDLNALHGAVDTAAEFLINRFCEAGHADLLRDYAFPLTFQVLGQLMGFPHDHAKRAFEGMAAMLDGVDAQQGEMKFGAALLEVIQAKRAHPGKDLTSRLIAYPEELSDEELVMQAALVFAAGCEPTTHLILTALRLMMTTDDFADGVHGGSLSIRDAIDEVLFTDPPLANFPTSYPRQPILLDDTWLPAHQPVVISLTACNRDPAISGRDRTGNRSHLSWGVGPHACPAAVMARVIAERGLEQILDALPEIRLVVHPDELIWRPGPFHRALTGLPVVFPRVQGPMALAVPSLLTPINRNFRKAL